MEPISPVGKDVNQATYTLLELGYLATAYSILGYGHLENDNLPPEHMSIQIETASKSIAANSISEIGLNVAMTYFYFYFSLIEEI